MSLIKNPSYNFEKKLTEKYREYSMYEYHFNWSDRRDGFCRVYIDLVRKCSFQFTQAQMRRFRQLDIQREDLCICLDDFHPHGKGLYPDRCNFMRKGFGARILKDIIGGLEDVNAKFIYTVASTPSMKKFIKKQNWIPCNRRKTIWFLNLQK